MTEDARYATFPLPPALDATMAAPLAGALRSLRGRPLIVDASQVEKLSTPCVQVLLSTRATWIADKVEMRVEPMSPAFKEAATLLGAAAEFERNPQ